MICAVCREELTLFGRLGYLHPGGQVHAEDGHETVAIQERALQRV